MEFGPGLGGCYLDEGVSAAVASLAAVAGGRIFVAVPGLQVGSLGPPAASLVELDCVQSQEISIGLASDASLAAGLSQKLVSLQQERVHSHVRHQEGCSDASSSSPCLDPS